MTVRDISPAVIQARPDNRAFGGIDREALKPLTESIRKRGILQPLIVREIAATDGYQYELIAGHRRRAAALEAGLTTLPCNVIEVAEAADAEVVSLLENLQRQDIHPLDEALAFERLQQLGLANVAISAQVGCHRNHVAARLRLCALIPAARDAWQAAPKLPIQAAQEIAAMPPHLQERFVKKNTKGGSELVAQYGTISYWAESQSEVLAYAPWDPDDADLVPAAGSCTDCPKRFDYQPRLFAEQEQGEQTEIEGRCGDKKCWRGKLQAHVDQARERAVADGLKPVEISGKFLDDKPDGPVPRDRVVLFDNMTDEEKAKRKAKPKPLLIIDGPEAGSIVEGFIKPKRRDEWEAAAERRNKERLALEAERLPTFGRVLDALDAEGTTERDLAILMLPPILEWMAMRSGSWEAEGMIARARFDGQPDDYGNIAAKDREGAEKLLDQLHPISQILVLLAGDAVARTDQGVDFLSLIAKELSVTEAPADADAAPAADAGTD